MKFRWPFLILLMAGVLIAIAGFLRYSTTRKALIKVSIFDLSAQLSDFQKWEKWDKLISDEQYSLHINSPAAFVLQKQANGPASVQYITLKPVNADILTQIEWTKTETGFEWMMAKLAGKNEIQDQLNSLKTFAENPSNLYGYHIKIMPVNDPMFCLYRKTVAKENAKDKIPQMIQELGQYLSKNNIPYKRDYYYVSYFPVDNKNIEIAVGVSLTEEFKTKDSFEIIKFPANGRLLVGDYEGPPTGINKLYAAMDKYVTDKKMRKVALPMEKFPYNPSLNTEVIKMQLIYPVY
jgi:effector-binding domain-containing protein